MTFFLKRTFATVLFVLAVYSSESMADDCNIIRGSFDVGSASTKMKIALVDKCRNKILQLMDKDVRAIPFRQDLMVMGNGQFSESIQRNALKVFADLKAKGEALGVVQWVGVATAAFRDAKNARWFLDRVQAESGISIKIISQAEEATFGLRGVQARIEGGVDDIVVWDVGGGSQQVSTLNAQGEIEMYLTNMASVAMKNYIIQNLQGKDLSKVYSPNPIGLDALTQASVYAESFFEKEVPPGIQAKLRSGRVIGIGGVHTASILKQVKTEKGYSLKDLEQAMVERADFTDAQVGGDFFDSDISNLALISGLMKKFEIDYVQTLDVTMNDAILAFPELAR